MFVISWWENYSVRCSVSLYVLIELSHHDYFSLITPKCIGLPLIASHGIYVLLIQVLHIFSHIRMTYVVHSLEVNPGDSSSSSLPCRWFQLSELGSAPIPTVTKKILDHFIRSTGPGLSDKTNNRKSRKKIAATESTTSKQLRLDKFFN
ncbi:hypothetical protein AHF37_01589 [Paragonimus kellicotti]|nr:hypothetical protein AHF37_01589 [Paragonimus kellicotti]